ncbi:hypothetical protein, partial [Vibrio parahaemolyticus]|uniref:hypothetical protein n=1 Tax=Vibrio parahaemolyticus TaxID=670 RepID=UPI002152FFE4
LILTPQRDLTMAFELNRPQKRPVYFDHHSDGFWCSIDGQPEYFKTKQEMYMFACGECRELIQITDENERELRESGAFDADYCDE